MFSQVLAYLNDKGIVKYQQEKTESSQIVVFGVKAANGSFHCAADVNEAERHFLFVTVHPLPVPIAIYTQISELILYLNFPIFLGNFELDFEGQRLRFKTSTLWDSSGLSLENLHNLIYKNIQTMDFWLQLFNDFIEGKIDLPKAKIFIKNQLY